MKILEDGFETEFNVALAPDEVWPLIAFAPENKSTSAADAPRGAQVWLPGWEMTGEIREAVRSKRLVLRKDAFPCKGTEIVIALEADGAGTRVRLAQTDFAANANIPLEALALGADFIFRDFALFLETGIVAGRHMNAWMTPFGADTREMASGLRVESVQLDTLAGRAGLKAGDHLLTLAGANVVTMRDLTTALRTQRGAERVEIAWVRGRERMVGFGSF